MFRYLTK